MDYYLWIAGEYWSWKRNPDGPISKDLQAHFKRLGTNPDTERTFADLRGLQDGAPSHDGYKNGCRSSW
jgi:hypothetical protein